MTPTKPYYHRIHGAQLMYVFDGDRACRNHPNEWSDKPWTDEAAKAAEANQSSFPTVPPTVSTIP